MFTFHLCVHFTLVCGTVRVTTFDKLEPTLYFVDLLEETLDKYVAIHVYAMLSKIHPGTETTFKYIDSNNVWLSTTISHYNEALLCKILGSYSSKAEAMQFAEQMH